MFGVPLSIQQTTAFFWAAVNVVPLGIEPFTIEFRMDNFEITIWVYVEYSEWQLALVQLFDIIGKASLENVLAAPLQSGV